MKKKTLDFGGYDYTDIEDIQSIESEGEIIKVWVRNIYLEDLWHERISKGEYKAKSSAWLKDQDGNEIETTEFSKETFLKLRDYKKKGTPIEVLAKVIKIEKKDYFINGLKLLRHRSGTKKDKT